MAGTAEMLTAAEAAVVARVSLRDVNRTIDEHILPGDLYRIDDGRHVLADACPLISFYFETADQLTAEARLDVIRSVSPRLSASKHGQAPEAVAKEYWTIHVAFLTIDLAPFAHRAAERLKRLRKARDMVVSAPEILGGLPVIRGTRVPVYDVAASLSAGVPVASILAAYPTLDAEKVELAGIYADANPPRGRPRHRSALPKGATLISERRLPRRSPAG